MYRFIVASLGGEKRAAYRQLAGFSTVVKLCTYWLNPGEKLVDVVGLYLSPPENAVVFCVDEKSSIQALDRTQPGLPLKKGRAGTMTHDYKRHGTTTLFAALDVKSGVVIGECLPRHRAKEYLKFLRRIDREVKRNPGASLHDLGDGVLGLEFHSKMNAIGQDTLNMIMTACTEAEQNWEAMIVANGADNFSVGANLMMLMMEGILVDDRGRSTVQTFARTKLASTAFLLEYRQSYTTMTLTSYHHHHHYFVDVLFEASWNF